MKKILMFLFTFFVIAGCIRTSIIDIHAEAEVIRKIMINGKMQLKPWTQINT